MVALTREAARINLESRWSRFLEPLPLLNATIAYKGGLACLFFTGATKGEVAPATTNPNLVGIGRFAETVDNTADGLSVKVEAGVFVWANGTAGDAVDLTDLGQFVYAQDDNTVGKLPYVATSDPVIVTVTPTAANSTKYALSIRYKKPGQNLWRVATIAALGDATATATEICDAYRTSLTEVDDLTGVITGSGTATLILTGAEGVEFEVLDIGTGVSAVVVTDAGTLTRRPKAGILVGLDSDGPQVLSHPAIYGGFIS